MIDFDKRSERSIGLLLRVRDRKKGEMGMKRETKKVGTYPP